MTVLRSGLFVGEGSSDQPLADLMVTMFFRLGLSVSMSTPDYSRLAAKIRKDVRSKIGAGVALRGSTPDVIAVHRDADRAGAGARRSEIARAISALDLDCTIVPVVPVRMTEAWLLLDEDAIRRVAGNPRGRVPLDLPSPSAAESLADPKAVLHEVLLAAADVAGRRRQRLAKRFSDSRRQLLERLQLDGAHTRLESWRQFDSDVSAAAARLVP